MTTTAIPSLDVNDFKSNIQDFDAMANGAGVYTDRFGKERLTLDAFMAANGFEVPVAFASGIAVSRTTQTVTYNGNTYHALPSALPFTTTGTFNSAQWALLRQDANNVTSATLTVSGFAATAALDGAWIHFAGRDVVGDGAGGMFRYSASSTATADDGIVFAPAGGGRLFREVDDGQDIELDWFLPGNYNPDTTSCKTAAEKAWAYCVANKRNLHHGPRRYRISEESSFPYGRINGLPPVALTDYGGIRVSGSGMATILETASVSGADVIQLNGADNLEICNFSVRSYISGSSHGSNGVSVTGGFDRLHIHDIWPVDLAFVDKTTYVDGGKALTIQTPVSGQTVKCGTLKAWNIFAKGCVYGAGVEMDLVAASTMPTSIDIDVVADSCREAVVISAGEATGAISGDWQSGIIVKAVAINCMNDVNLSRAHGVEIDCTVVTTKTDAARILSPTGSKWNSADTVADVIGLRCAYAHDSTISIRGQKGSCSYKALVGGATAGSSGLSAATQGCKINVDISGTASSADFGAIDSGGNVTSQCIITASGDTAAPVTAHYAPSSNNLIISGNTQMLGDLLVQGAIKFTYTDGKTVYGEIGYDDESVTVKQTLGSSASLRPFRVLKNDGSTVMYVRNDGGLGLVTESATSVSTVAAVALAYDEASSTFLGYVPIYASKA